MEVLKKAARLLAVENGLEEAASERIVATLVAMRLLKMELSEFEDEWSLLFAKAEKWIARQSVKAPAPFSDLEGWIAGFFEKG